MSAVRSTLRALRTRYRRVRFRAWVLRARIAMWRAGGRLVVDAPYGCEWDGPPRLKMERDGPLDRGTFTLRLGRQVSFGRGVLLEVWGLADNLLELGDRSYFLDDVHVDLRHGSIRIAERTRVCHYAIVKSAGELVLGSDTTISQFCKLHCDERIEVGDHCGIGERVTMVDSFHPHDGTDTPHLHHAIQKAPISIGRNVFMGANAIVGAGTTVGDNAMIGGNSVLSGKSYPAGWLTGGIPAKPIRELAAAETAAAEARPMR